MFQFVLIYFCKNFEETFCSYRSYSYINLIFSLFSSDDFRSFSTREIKKESHIKKKKISTYNHYKNDFKSFIDIRDLM